MVIQPYITHLYVFLKKRTLIIVELHQVVQKYPKIVKRIAPL